MNSHSSIALRYHGRPGERPARRETCVRQRNGGGDGGDHDAGPGATLSDIPGVYGEGRAAATVFVEGGE